MKTQIIVLESHDDLVSVKDRMSWAKSPRILLVWSKGDVIALRPLDLKILQRHARSLGATLGLVTRDPHVRREAAALDLPVFDSPRSAQAGHWSAHSGPEFPPPRSPGELHTLRDAAHPARSRWQSHLLIRLGAFTLGVLAVLALGFLFLPHAEITLSPETRIQSLTIPVTADPALKTVVITGSVPAYEGTYEVTGTRQVPSTGEMTLPEAEAKGVARFRNLTSSKIQIPIGTIVHTLGASPVNFATSQLAEIPAGVGRTVDVPIEAVGAGADGNLEIDLVQVIEGPLSASLAVTNPAPTSGGRNRTVAAPSEEDRQRLHDSLMDSLRTQVQLKMLADLPVGSVIFPDTLKVVAVLEETPEPPVGKIGPILTLSMRVKFSALYASGEDLKELSWMALSASLDKDFSASSETATFKMIGDPVTGEAGRTSFNLQMEQGIHRSVDSTRVFSLIQGMPVESAAARLEESVSIEAPPAIRMTPRWWPWLPLVPFRMTVLIQ